MAAAGTAETTASVAETTVESVSQAIEDVLREGGATIGFPPEYPKFAGCAFKIACGGAIVRAYHKPVERGESAPVSPLLKMTTQIFRELPGVGDIYIRGRRWVVPLNPFDDYCIVSALIRVGRDATFEGNIRTRAAWICPEWADNLRGQVVDFTSVKFENASEATSGCSSNCSSQEGVLFGDQCELNKALRDLTGFSLSRTD